MEQSFSSISGHFRETFDRVQILGNQVEVDAERFRDALEPLEENLCQPLAALREDMQGTKLREYEPTGATPEKVKYEYPTELPRTGAHDALIAAMRSSSSPTPTKPSPSSQSPLVLPDISLTPVANKSPSRQPDCSSPSRQSQSEGSSSKKNPLSMSLREVNPNIATTSPVVFNGGAGILSPLASSAANENSISAAPMLKPNLNTRTRSSRLSKKPIAAVVADGPENVPPPPPALRSSTRRKSPRLR